MNKIKNILEYNLKYVRRARRKNNKYHFQSFAIRYREFRVIELNLMLIAVEIIGLLKMVNIS
jgi:hypothetical protein